METMSRITHPEEPALDPVGDPDRRILYGAISRQRELLLDLDVNVDGARRDLDDALAAVQDAVRRRDAAAAHLTKLIHWYEEQAA